jgi:hypothetical protein
MAKKRGVKVRAVKSAKKGVTLRRSASTFHQIAHVLFFVGILFAILAGLFRNVKVFSWFTTPSFIVSFLVLLGFFVGLFNLTKKETIPFLIAVTALMLAGIVNLGYFNLFGLWPSLGGHLRAVLSNLVVFVVPIALLLGLKTIYELASD